ncbi:hypothetical protein [uncultured Paracoccus sp.]|uniref:hypothetical protein n=1 Tax=uncultured Paracoccus sp. TaxID=189685 RepID=UPI00261D7271|nr:hypothetical protein [uncultured Paracoccus sp.]
MTRLLALFLSILIATAPLLPVRAGASGVVILCADGIEVVVAVDDAGRPAESQAGTHCPDCVITPLAALPAGFRLERPAQVELRLRAPQRNWRVRTVIQPNRLARGPPSGII